MVTDHYLKMLAVDGHEATLFCPAYAGAAKKEKFHGYTIVRRGNKLTVYLEAFLYYMREARGKFDIVIDQINTIPFFTPLYVKERRIAVFYQLAAEYWFYETPPIIAHIGHFLEPIYLSLYKNTQTITISPSSKQDLDKLGFKDVTVVYVGLDVKPLKKPKKKQPLIVYVGRVTRAKRVDHVVKAFAHLVKKLPNYRLAIIGTGPEGYQKQLKTLTQRLDVEEKIDFLGRVNAKERNTIVARAKALVNPSIREGWGLVVLEANAMGTPAVVYDVPGLRDSVKNGENGIVISGKQNWENLAYCIEKVIRTDTGYKRRLCTAYAKKFVWDNSYDEYSKSLKRGLP